MQRAYRGRCWRLLRQQAEIAWLYEGVARHGSTRNRGRLPSMLAEQPGRENSMSRPRRNTMGPKTVAHVDGKWCDESGAHPFPIWRLPLSSHPPPHPAEPARQSTASGRRGRGQTAGECCELRRHSSNTGRDGDVGAYAGDAQGGLVSGARSPRTSPGCFLPEVGRVRAQCEGKR